MLPTIYKTHNETTKRIKHILFLLALKKNYNLQHYTWIFSKKIRICNELSFCKNMLFSISTYFLMNFNTFGQPNPRSSCQFFIIATNLSNLSIEMQQFFKPMMTWPTIFKILLVSICELTMPIIQCETYARFENSYSCFTHQVNLDWKVLRAL